MENRKNTILLTVIAVATLLVAVVGATFAYFTAQGTGSKQKQIEVTSETIDSMAFYIDKDIDIEATTLNFTQGGSDVTDTITAKATFNANNSQAADFCYTVDLIVSANTFAYTVLNTERLPELTLHVTKDAGTAGSPKDIIAVPTTEADAGDLTGDSPSSPDQPITINIPTTAGGSDPKHKISAAAGQRVVDTWKVTVTFVNHDFDQSSPGEQGIGEVNTGKEFRATLKFSSTPCA